MEPWSGCAWLQILYTASEIVHLSYQGGRQGRGLHRQGRECLLDVIFSGSTTLQGFFYSCVLQGDTAHCRDEVL